MHQTPFQRHLWLVAINAHAAGDRSDARILMRMIETIDGGDYTALEPLHAALRPTYRDVLGRLPADRGVDLKSLPGGRAGAERGEASG